MKTVVQRAIFLLIAVFAIRPVSAATSGSPDLPPCTSNLAALADPDSTQLAAAEPQDACSEPFVANRTHSSSSVVRASDLRIQLSELKLSPDEVHDLLLNAKSPAEHLRLAGYYSVRADADLAQAMHQQQMALNYSAIPVTNSSKFIRGTVDHCVAIVHRLKQHAAKMHRLQHEQEQLARQAAE